MRPFVLLVLAALAFSPALLSAHADPVGLVFVHGADGAAAASPFAAPTVREIPTGYSLGEPTLGVFADGTILVQGVFSSPSVKPQVVRSTDDGATWQLDTPNAHAYTEDPYLFRDASTGRVFSDDLVFPCSNLAWSDDEGATWSGTSVMGCTVSDHQTLFAGRPVTSVTRGYPNVVYYCAMQLGATFQASLSAGCEKSLDGGVTWAPTGAPYFNGAVAGAALLAPDAPLSGAPCSPAHGHGAAAPDGTIFIPAGWCGAPQLAISHDEGATWRIVKVADNGMPSYTDCATDDPRTCETSYDHDASVAATADGTVYYFYVAADRLPYLVASHDEGASWGAPRMVAPAQVKHATFPQLAMGADGKLAWVYYADLVGNGDEWHGALGLTPDGGDSIATAIVNPVTDPFVRGTCCAHAHDFIDVQVAPDGSAWGVWTDSCVDDACTTTSASGDEGVVATLLDAPSLR